MVSFVLLLRAYALHGKERVLRATVAFFANARLLAPQVAVDGIALGHFVVAKTLRETHASAVGKFAQQGEHLPLDIGGRALGGIAEENLILDLQAPQLRLKNI